MKIHFTGANHSFLIPVGERLLKHLYASTYCSEKNLKKCPVPEIPVRLFLNLAVGKWWVV